MSTKNLYQCFTTDNARKVVTFRDNAPEWLKDAVYECHQGMLPNDWIYAACRSFCARLDDDGSLVEDEIHEWADGEVDVYNSARFKWASEFCNSNVYGEAEEHANDCSSGKEDTLTRLGAIQYFALESIARTLFAAYEEAREEENAAEDDAEEEESADA